MQAEDETCECDDRQQAVEKLSKVSKDKLFGACIYPGCNHAKSELRISLIAPYTMFYACSNHRPFVMINPRNGEIRVLTCEHRVWG